eukprot:GHVP01047690.1.p1 GENE.GHVP01047690.1~~GHVP01047690.1.p1  ORF type:complete len:382 (+),score=105.69 GHVP01047690.1:37-1182(+)
MEGPSLALRQLKKSAIRDWATYDLSVEEIKDKAMKGLDLVWNAAVAHEEQLTKLHEDVENSESQIQTLEEEKQEIIRAARDAYERSEIEIQQWKDKCENLAQELDEAKALETKYLVSPRQNISSESSAISDEEKANLWEKLQDKENKIRSLIFEKTELKDQLKKAKSDNNTLATENQEFQSMAEKSGNFKAKLSDANSRIQALENENSDLKLKARERENACEELKCALEESKSSNEEFQRHIRADRFLNRTNSVEEDIGFGNSGSLEAELLQTQGHSLDRHTREDRFLNKTTSVKEDLGFMIPEKPGAFGTDGPVVNLHNHFHTHVHNHVHKHSHFHRYAEKGEKGEKAKEMGIAKISKTQTRPTRLRLVVEDKKLLCSAK